MSEEAGERGLNEVRSKGWAGGPDAALAVGCDGVQGGVRVRARRNVWPGNLVPGRAVPAFDRGEVAWIVEPDELVADRPDLGRGDCQKRGRGDLHCAEPRHQDVRPLSSVPVPGDRE